MGTPACVPRAQHLEASPRGALCGRRPAHGAWWSLGAILWGSRQACCPSDSGEDTVAPGPVPSCPRSGLDQAGGEPRHGRGLQGPVRPQMTPPGSRAGGFREAE